MLDVIITFFVSVGASVVGNYISYSITNYMTKRLGRDE